MANLKVQCDAFLPFATRYVEWVREAAEEDSPSPSELLRLLADLQAAALRLPDKFKESDLTDSDPERYRRLGGELALRVCKKLPLNEYSAVFDPVNTEDRDAIMINLDDDIGDIYNDLFDGIQLAESGKHGDALWHWRFSYWSHWGRHLMHAYSALYSHLAGGNAYVNE